MISRLGQQRQAGGDAPRGYTAQSALPAPGLGTETLATGLAERQPKLRRFFAYLADGAAEECRRLRRGVAGFDALAQVNDIHLGPFPAGVGSFHPPGSLVALGRLRGRPKMN